MLSKYKKGTILDSLNYNTIPVSVIDMTESGMNEFNSIVEYVESLNLQKIKRTPSNGISISRMEKYTPRYDLRDLPSMIELTVINIDGCWRIQFRDSFERMNETGISGKHAFWKFNDLCRSAGINIDDYTVINGAEVKKTIEPYIKKVTSNIFIDATLKNVHHLDFNSSFMSCLIEEYPEFTSIAEDLYLGRKENPINKGIMTNVIGYFQSLYHGAKWANLSKAAINGNNEKIRNYLSKLSDSGRIPLLINTDGIWYAGDIFHDEYEGVNLRQWKHDHTNCELLIKSPSAYQFRENGEVHTVLSGRTLFDKVKPRSQWEWGDIFKDNVKSLAYKLENDRIIRVLVEE